LFCLALFALGIVALNNQYIKYGEQKAKQARDIEAGEISERISVLDEAEYKLRRRQIDCQVNVSEVTDEYNIKVAFVKENMEKLGDLDVLKLRHEEAEEMQETWREHMTQANDQYGQAVLMEAKDTQKLRELMGVRLKYETTKGNIEELKLVVARMETIFNSSDASNPNQKRKDTTLPIKIALGSSYTEVSARLGKPVSSLGLGTREFYRYSLGDEVTFENGRAIRTKLLTEEERIRKKSMPLFQQLKVAIGQLEADLNNKRVLAALTKKEEAEEKLLVMEAR
jgi:hypothetical protein